MKIKFLLTLALLCSFSIPADAQLRGGGGGNITADGSTITNSAGTISASGTLPVFNMTTASGSYLNWSTSSPVFNVPAMTLTDTSGSGTIALRGAETINGCAFASTNVETITQASCVYVGAPSAGTNTTVGTPYSIYAAGGIYSNSGGLSVQGGGAINFNGNLSSTGTSTWSNVGVIGSAIPNSGIYRQATGTQNLDFSAATQYAGNIDAGAHWRIGGTGTPTILANACGSTTQGAIAANGNDQGFQVTVGTAAVTSCVITFASAFITAPRSAVLFPANAAAAAAGTTVAYVSSLTTTTITIAGTALAGASYYVQVY